MALPDVTVIRQNGGLGRRNPSDDMVSGLLAGVAGPTGNEQLNTTYELRSVDDFKAITGLDEYDEDTGVFVQLHIEDFFLKNPDGTLFLRLYDNSVALTAAVDKDEDYLQQLIRDTNGRIRQVGVVFNPASGFVPDQTDSLEATVLAAIPILQQLVKDNRSKHRPLSAVLEGKYFSGTATAATDLRSLNGPEFQDGVSVVIGRDNRMQERIAAAGGGLFEGSASVGALLGTISRARVNESVAWVERFNLQEVAENSFLESYLSSGMKLASYGDDIQTLNEKGYIFARPIADQDGLYWNDSHTCTELASDYAYIERNRTMDKAVRLVRKAQLPRLSGPILIDADTGKIEATFAKSLEAIGRAGLAIMSQNKEISGTPDVFVNPDQDVLATDELVTEVAIVPTGTARKITTKIRYRNPAVA